MSKNQLYKKEQLSIVPTKKRVLSISFTYLGFGYTVFEDPNSVIDWGHCQAPKHDKFMLEGRIISLIQKNKIEIVLCKNPNDRIDRVKALTKLTKNICKELEIDFNELSKNDIENVFESFGSYTKYQRAGIVAQHLPDLAYKLPPERKIWQTEDLRLAIFESACLALSYFYLN